MKTSSVNSLLHQILIDVRGSLRFKWHAITCAWIVCILGWLFVMTIPNVYEASTRVFVDTNSRLNDVLAQVAYQSDVNERINIVRQALLGRPVLEKVASSTRLFTPGMSEEDQEGVIEGLLTSIEVQTGRASERNVFAITYRNSDKELSVDVVSALLNTFVEDVLEQREEGGASARRFLEEQVAYYKEQLDAADARLADFKRENIGLMPGDNGDYFRRLAAEQTALQEQRVELRIAESRYAELGRQLSREPVTIAETSDSLVPIPGLESELSMRISELQNQLDTYLLRFTEAHPDVIAAREQLDRLVAQQREELAALSEDGNSLAASNNPVYQAVQMQLNETGVSIADMRARIRERETQIDELQGMLEIMPGIEAELARLEREYGNSRGLFEELSDQLERERIAGEGDEEQTINFEVLDPPVATADPVAPRRGLMILAVLVLGLGAGAVASHLLNSVKPVFVDVSQLREVLGIPVIGTVSIAYASQDRPAISGFAAVAAGLIGCSLFVLVFRESGSLWVQSLLNSI